MPTYSYPQTIKDASSDVLEVNVGVVNGQLVTVKLVPKQTDTKIDWEEIALLCEQLRIGCHARVQWEGVFGTSGFHLRGVSTKPSNKLPRVSLRGRPNSRSTVSYHPTLVGAECDDGSTVGSSDSGRYPNTIVPLGPVHTPDDPPQPDTKPPQDAFLYSHMGAQFLCF